MRPRESYRGVRRNRWRQLYRIGGMDWAEFCQTFDWKAGWGR